MKILKDIQGFTLIELVVVVLIMGILSSMVRAQGLLVLPAGKSAVPQGAAVSVIQLDPHLFYAAEPDYLAGE